MKKVLLIIFVMSLSACGNKERLKITERGDLEITKSRVNDSIGSDADSAEPDVVFADVLSEVFEASCTTCHSGYANYENVERDLDSILQEVFAGTMPQFGPPLSTEQKNLLEDWASLGALKE